MSKKTFLIILAAGLILLTCVPAMAQREYKSRLGEAVNRMTSVEGLVSHVESQKLLSLQAVEDLDKSMYEYAQKLKATLDAAVEDAKLCAETKGQKGTMASLQDYEEKLTPEHQKRFKAIQGRFQSMESKIPTGEIMCDRGLLESFGSGFADFKGTLTQEGVQKYRTKFPDLFQDREPEPDSSGPNVPEDWDLINSSIETCCGTEGAAGAGGGAGSAILSCVGKCLALKFAECLSCILSLYPATTTAVNEFDSCWSSCGSKYKYRPIMKAICRTGCVLTLIAKLG